MDDLFNIDPNQDFEAGGEFDFGTWEDGRDIIEAAFPSTPLPGQAAVQSQAQIDSSTLNPPLVSKAVDSNDANDTRIQVAEDRILRPINDTDYPDTSPYLGHTHSPSPLGDDSNNAVKGNYFPPFLFANHTGPENEARAAAVAEYAAALSPTPPSRGRQGIMDEMREEDSEAERCDKFGDSSELKIPPGGFKVDATKRTVSGSPIESGATKESLSVPSLGFSPQSAQAAGFREFQRLGTEEVPETPQEGECYFDDDGSCSMDTEDSDESSDEDSSTESNSPRRNFFDVVLAPGSALKIEGNETSAQNENVIRQTVTSNVPVNYHAPTTSFQPVTIPQILQQDVPTASIENQEINTTSKRLLSPNNQLNNDSQVSDDEDQPQKKKLKLSRSRSSDGKESEYKLAGVKASDAMDVDSPSPGIKAGSSSPPLHSGPFESGSSPQEAAMHQPRNPMGKGELKALDDNHGAKRVSTSPRRTRSRGVARRVSERIARRTSK